MPITNIPYDWTLDGAHSNPPWNMDPIHIQQLYRICERVRPTRVVEIGSYMGASTSAFVEAMRDGYVQELVCYELNPLPELLRVLKEAPEGAKVRVVDVAYPSQPIPADLIFIDGDHEHGAGWDTLAALCMGVPHIVMHDHTCLREGLGCRGVENAAGLLKCHDNYNWREDCGKRPGMWTHRGLFYARHEDALLGWLPEDLP